MSGLTAAAMSNYAPASRFLERLQAQQRRLLRQAMQSAAPAQAQDLQAWYCGPHPIGWVDRARAQDMLTQWPQCALQDGRLVWSVMDWSGQERSQYLQQWLLAQREAGRLSGWRGEAYRCWATPAYPPQPNQPGLFECERAGFRYLGLRSHAVHINGWSQDGELWCGRRSASKATDPGLLDSLSAGGMTAGQSLWTVLQRELWEEAGLQLAHGQSLQWLGCTHSRQRVPEGWHDETLWVFNLVLTDEQLPRNQDGEVAEFVRLTPEQVVQHLCAGDFTSDAALALQLSLV